MSGSKASLGGPDILRKSNIISFPQKAQASPYACGKDDDKDPCAAAKKKLDEMWQQLQGGAQPGTMQHMELLQARRAFNLLVDWFNASCVPRGWARYNNKFALGPTDVYLGTQTIHDFYGR